MANGLVEWDNKNCSEKYQTDPNTAKILVELESIIELIQDDIDVAPLIKNCHFHNSKYIVIYIYIIDY